MYLCTYALLSATLILSGCIGRQNIATEPILTPVVDMADATEIAEDVLAKMHFEVDKIDPDNGYIRTRPLAGAQFFEFWRSDNVGTENWIQSNLHSIRRTVEVNISQFGDEPDFGCNVRIERLSLPERQVTSSSRAYEMFSRSSSTMQTLRLNPEQQSRMQWIDLGKDTELEKEIINRIKNRIIGGD